MRGRSDGVPRERDAVPPRVVVLYRQALSMLSRNRPLRARSSAPIQPRSALSKPEIEALESVGANLEPWPEHSEDDPVMRSAADYMALLESSHSTAEAARFLGVDASRIRQRIRERSLFGIEYEGEWRLPRFQFERRRVLPGLAQVLGALDPDISPLDVVQWFLTPNADLEQLPSAVPASPREWLLRSHSPAVVAALARDLNASMA